MSLENLIISFCLCLKLLFVFIIILLFFEAGTLKMFSMAVCNDHKKIIVKNSYEKDNGSSRLYRVKRFSVIGDFL